MAHHPSPQSFDEIMESIKSTPPLCARPDLTHPPSTTNFRCVLPKVEIRMTPAEMERKRQERRERYRRT